MFNEELLKKLEFDIRFKYSPVYFEVKDFRILRILHHITTQIFKITTNESYVEFLLEFQKDDKIKCDCIFFIDVDNKRSDVISASYFNYRQKQNILLKLQQIPEYLYENLKKET